MKISYKRYFFQSSLFIIFPMLLLLLGTSCQKEIVDETATKIIGTWHQTSLFKDGAPAMKDSTRLLMQINANQICILCDSSAQARKTNAIISRSGWSYTGGLFNLAIDLPASWAATVNANSLSIQRADFNTAGNITKTTLKFERVTNIDFK